LVYWFVKKTTKEKIEEEYIKHYWKKTTVYETAWKSFGKRERFKNYSELTDIANYIEEAIEIPTMKHYFKNNTGN
jgi:hypothetical protein